MEKHFAVSGFVMNQSHTKLLMVFHKKLGGWVIPGGHLEKDECPSDGAKREVLEETGVEAKILNYSEANIQSSAKEIQVPNPYVTLEEFIPEKNGKEAHIHIDFIYLAEADENQTLIKQEVEVNDVKWMTLAEVLDSNTFNSVKVMAMKTLKGGEYECGSFDS